MEERINLIHKVMAPLFVGILVSAYGSSEAGFANYATGNSAIETQITNSIILRNTSGATTQQHFTQVVVTQFQAITQAGTASQVSRAIC